MKRVVRPTKDSLPPLFATLSEPDREQLAAQAAVRLYAKGAVVWSDGEMVDRVLVVKSGCLGQTLRDETDPEDYVLVAAYPTDALLARSLAIPRPALMDLRALVATSVLELPMLAIRPLAQRTPELYEAFSDLLVREQFQRLYFASRLAGAPVERRLAHVLWGLSRPGRNGRRVVDFKLGQAELAQLVGTDRSELSRRRQLLVRSGMLETTADGLELTPSFRMLLANEPGAPGFILDALK